MSSNCFNSLKKSWLKQLAFAFLLFLFSCSKNVEPVTPPPVITPPLTGTPDITVTTLLSNQGIIWGFDVLPNGNMLFTQKVGTMQLFDTSTRNTTTISGLPTNISNRTRWFARCSHFAGLCYKPQCICNVQHYRRVPFACKVYIEWKRC